MERTRHVIPRFRETGDHQTHQAILSAGGSHAAADRRPALHHRLEALHDHEGRGDVADTLEMVLEASGCDRANVRHRPRLLSDNGSSNISADLGRPAGQPEHGARPRYALSSPNPSAFSALDTPLVL